MKELQPTYHLTLGELKWIMELIHVQVMHSLSDIAVEVINEL